MRETPPCGLIDPAPGLISLTSNMNRSRQTRLTCVHRPELQLQTHGTGVHYVNSVFQPLHMNPASEPEQNQLRLKVDEGQTESGSSVKEWGIQQTPSTYCGFPGLENLPGFFKVALFLHTFPLLGRRSQLLHEGVCPTRAEQHVGLRRVREHWRIMKEHFIQIKQKANPAGWSHAGPFTHTYLTDWALTLTTERRSHTHRGRGGTWRQSNLQLERRAGHESVCCLYIHPVSRSETNGSVHTTTLEVFRTHRVKAGTNTKPSITCWQQSDILCSRLYTDTQSDSSLTLWAEPQEPGPEAAPTTVTTS